MKNRVQYIFLMVVAIATVGSFGCSKTKLPEGMPKLYPCALTIHYADGSAVDGATVGLYPADSGQWPGGGVTDKNGVVQAKTNGTYNGIAEGKYKVTVSKKEIPPIEAAKSMEEAMSRTTPQPVILVAPIFSDSQTTPLEVEIKQGKFSATLEVNKPE